MTPLAALLTSLVLAFGPLDGLVLSPVGPAPSVHLAETLVVPQPTSRPARGSWPLGPRPPVVHFFDPPAITWGRGHRGVDLAGHVGESVRTALAGRVSFVGRIAGVGIVVVDHGGTRTTYQPVHATVRVGARVAEGAVIGALEWLGTHCGATACLHWGWRRGATYLDPLLLVGAAPRPVRLLPLTG